MKIALNDVILVLKYVFLLSKLASFSLKIMMVTIGPQQWLAVTSHKPFTSNLSGQVGRINNMVVSRKCFDFERNPLKKDEKMYMARATYK